MKITFLGTGAGEGYPGMWCECPNCTYAREHGGHNIRLNTATLLDDDTMLDMNDSCFYTAARLGCSMAKIKQLLITHSDDDHLSSQVLWWRFMAAGIDALPQKEQISRSQPRFTPLPMMKVFGNLSTKHALMKQRPELFDEPSTRQMEYFVIDDGQVYESKNIRFTAIRSQHGAPGFCHNYVIERDGRTILYAIDTGGYDDDMFRIVKAHQYDCVIMEGTFGLGYNGPGHMCLEKNRIALQMLTEAGCWKKKPNMYLTHMSPHWTPPHDRYSEMLDGEDIHVAYDGLVVEI